MANIATIPHASEILEVMDVLPGEMTATDVPYVVIWHDAMDPWFCDRIVEHFEHHEEPYNFPHCGATSTREMELKDFSPELILMDMLSRKLNDQFFSYDISDYSHAWMQTYEKDGEYSTHMDQSPGISRKLTGLLMLSSPSEYEGGQINFRFPDVISQVPGKGSLLLFPGWVMHNVEPVISGTRKTINMGFWGPPFV